MQVVRLPVDALFVLALGLRHLVLAHETGVAARGVRVQPAVELDGRLGTVGHVDLTRPAQVLGHLTRLGVETVVIVTRLLLTHPRQQRSAAGREAGVEPALGIGEIQIEIELVVVLVALDLDFELVVRDRRVQLLERGRGQCEHVVRGHSAARATAVPFATASATRGIAIDTRIHLAVGPVKDILVTVLRLERLAARAAQFGIERFHDLVVTRLDLPRTGVVALLVEVAIQVEFVLDLLPLVRAQAEVVGHGGVTVGERGLVDELGLVLGLDLRHLAGRQLGHRDEAGAALDRVEAEVLEGQLVEQAAVGIADDGVGVEGTDGIGGEGQHVLKLLLPGLSCRERGEWFISFETPLRNQC